MVPSERLFHAYNADDMDEINAILIGKRRQEKPGDWNTAKISSTISR